MVLALTPLQAKAYLYTGSLNGGGGGIIGAGAWASSSTVFSWTIQDIGTQGGSVLWKYDYTFTVPSKNISHVLLEVTNPSVLADFTNFTSTPDDGPKTFTPDGNGNSNPSMPGNLYGMKFSSSNSTSLSFSFNTTHSPVWGDFYAKDGGVFAWNSGFLAADPTSAPSDSSIHDKILRPDGLTAVPIPAAIWLFGAGLVGLVGVRRKFKK